MHRLPCTETIWQGTGQDGTGGGGERAKTGVDLSAFVYQIAMSTGDAGHFFRDT